VPILLLLLGVVTAAAQIRIVPDEEVQRVHRLAILIDTHNDVPMKTVAGFDIGKPSEKGHTDLPRLRAGGVGATFFAAYVAAGYVEGNRSANRALEMIDTIRHDIAARYPDDFLFALTAADVERAHAGKKIAALIGIEGGHAIEDSPRLLRDFFRLGVRYMTLTHPNSTSWAGSAGDFSKPRTEPERGLTALGRDIVREMNRLGMMVDISHVSDQTFWDVLETSSAPVFASHSSCRALANVRRNMTDEMIVAMARKGGVIQINFSCEFLTGRKDASLSDVVAHIDHVKRIAGAGAIGIGSDFDGIPRAPAGLDDVSKFPNLTRALLEKGYPAEEIRQIYGGNTLRLMREVERTASHR
jgi:membrane dipeptidase